MTENNLNPKEILKEIEKINNSILKERLNLGYKDYGDLDIRKDKRDYLKEAEEEIIDAIVYLYFQLLRIKKIK